ISYVVPGVNFIVGSVADESGATDIEIEITLLPSGATTFVNCVDPTPEDSVWSCLWQPGDLSGLTGFDLRARASDRYGNQSGWSPIHHLIVDTSPPTVTLDATVDDFLADGFINGAELLWNGQATDDYEVSRVAVCTDATYNTACQSASTSLPAPSVTWQYDFNSVLAGDGISQTVSLHGFDAVGNRSVTPLVRTFIVDTVSPVITTTVPANVRSVLTPEETQTYSGTVGDGGGVALMTALVVPPDGVLRVEPVQLDGGDWSFTPLLDQLGEYLIQITATDLAGNVSSTGLFTLLISNRPPLVAGENYTTTADLELTVAAPGVLDNDSDLDGDPLSVITFDNPSSLGASVVITPDGGLSYDPTLSPVLAALLPGESLLDTFDYTVSDSAGNVVVATVSVLVSGVVPVAICIARDVNQDNHRDIIDIGLVTSHWGLTEGDPGWDPIYDLNDDGVIDVADIIAVAECLDWLPAPQQ
ncbi:MAG: cadherin-like domain-containing protein, partial [Anaerolineae bacterium]|nr:cadherin-like domain-containing protein [Anaerolineae bacterium]